MKTIVSIIVPVYNVSKYIEKCVDSILKQTFCDFELLLIDDGSTDNSSYICDLYAKKDNRVVVVHKKNGGLSSARNRGLDIAKGDYVSFVDSDDYIEPNFIESLLDELMKKSSDLIVCNFSILDLNNNSLIETPSIIDGDVDEEGYWKLSACTRYGLTVVVWNKLYKKTIFEHLRFKDGVFHEDQEIIHKIISKCDKITFINKKLYNYIKRPQSITNKKTQQMFFDEINSLYNRAIYFLATENFYDFYLKTTNRMIIEYCELSYFFKKNSSIKFLIKKIIHKGRYGSKIKRFILWNIQLTFPKIMYKIIYKK